MDHDYRRLINSHSECILIGRRSASGETKAGRENRWEDWSNDHARVGLYNCHSVDRRAEQNGVEGAVSILVQLDEEAGCGVRRGSPDHEPMRPQPTWGGWCLKSVSQRNYDQSVIQSTVPSDLFLLWGSE